MSKPTLTTRIDLDTAAANGADGMSDPDFEALCERFEAILEAECERLGWACEVVTDARASGGVRTTSCTDEDGNEVDGAHDVVNAAWDRALAG